jgi:acyl-CoA-binding protein
MLKASLGFSAACTLASLLFFLAPAFRLAFRVSLAPWSCLLLDCYHKPSPELDALKRQAEQKHDAEGIAFVAIRLWNGPESARLAEEAVHLDPKLTWIYAVVQGASPSQFARWLPELQSQDPQNALPFLIAAARINTEQILANRIAKSAADEPPAWRDAMAAAFQSTKLDDYGSRCKELDRRCLLRYAFDLPNLPGCHGYWMPTEATKYAKLLLQTGDLLQARGDRRGAFEKYWEVARFSQVVGAAGGRWLNQEFQNAYSRLQAFSEKEGNHEQAQLYAYLRAQVSRAEQNDEIAGRMRVRGSDSWNAFLAGTSWRIMLLSAVLMLTCFIKTVVRSQPLRWRSLRPGRVTLALFVSGSVGLLLSSATLYAVYKPYAEILQRYVHTGDEREIGVLLEFLGHAQNLPFDAVQFWFAVTGVCVVSLFLAVGTFLLQPFRANAST